MPVTQAHGSARARTPDTPIKVLYLIDSLGPGGAEHLLDMYLEPLADCGVIASVAVMHEREGNPVAERIERRGVEVTMLGVHRLRQPSALPRTFRAIRDAAPDVVHTQLEFANVLGTIAARLTRVPSVATLHTIETPEPGSREAHRIRLMYRVLKRMAPRVVAVSESARRHYLDVDGLVPDRTITVHNGIDLEPFIVPDDSARSEIRQRHGIPAEAAIVLTVAVQREPKGIQHMIGALPRILTEHPDLYYLLVGDGPHQAALRELAAGSGVADRVVFAGTRSDVPRYTAAADVFVLPSLTEALPTVIAEAMAGALPVVATAVGGIPEMVNDGTTGLIVPPDSPQRLADAVKRLLSQPNLAAAMGAAGRRSALESFDVRSQAGHLADLYRHLTDQSAGSREGKTS
ncbi:glycosyltransferase [bacterium]|nr:glycosyltransferase [bacterium]